MSFTRPSNTEPKRVLPADVAALIAELVAAVESEHGGGGDDGDPECEICAVIQRGRRLLEVLA